MGDLHILPALLREDLRELVDVAGGVGQSTKFKPEGKHRYIVLLDCTVLLYCTVITVLLVQST